MGRGNECGWYGCRCPVVKLIDVRFINKVHVKKQIVAVVNLFITRRRYK